MEYGGAPRKEEKKRSPFAPRRPRHMAKPLRCIAGRLRRERKGFLVPAVMPGPYIRPSAPGNVSATGFASCLDPDLFQPDLDLPAPVEHIDRDARPPPAPVPAQEPVLVPSQRP